MDADESLKLSHQLCFPIYALARQIIKAYTPYLQELGLTYTQYVVMMVLWEHQLINIKELGNKLYLDSGTLTPVVQKMEKSGLLIKRRSMTDQRQVEVQLTEQGLALKQKAYKVPAQMACKVGLKEEEIGKLYELTYKLLSDLTKN